MVEKLGDRVGWSWVGALALFVVAASTGALYRFMLAYGTTWDLNPTNVRHAHSHLMYFGWVTPALLVLIGLACASTTRARSTLRWIAGGSLLAALGAYPLFLAYGYSLVAVGGSRMPIAVMGSTLNMIPWIAFIVWYTRQSRQMGRGPAQAHWEASLVFLALSMVGAGMLAILKPLGIHSDVWSAALTHVFLDYFSEGWFVLAVLGLAYQTLNPAESVWTKRSLILVCLGLPFTFALGMPSLLVPEVLQWVARVGGVLLSLGLLLNVLILWPSAREGRGWWRIPLVLLALKTVGQLIGAVSLGTWWSDLHGMRILYLHLMLLGFVSLGLMAAAVDRWGPHAGKARGAFALAVGAVLLSLLPLSSIWPAPWGGGWPYVVAAWISLLPILVVLRMIAGAVMEIRRKGPGGSEGARAIRAGQATGEERAVLHSMAARQ